MRTKEYYEIDTVGGGPVYVRPGSAGSLMLSTTGGYGDDRRVLTVNGVEYTATLHLVRNHEDGTWELYQDKDGRTWHALYMSRARLKNGRLEDPSSAARKKATAMLLEAGRRWAADHEREIQEAELEEIEIQIGTCDTDIEKLEAQLATVRERKNHLIIQRGLTRTWLNRDAGN